MELKNCCDFIDILCCIIHDGITVEKAEKKVWSAKKYRKSDDIIYARKTYREHEAIIDRLTIGQ